MSRRAVAAALVALAFAACQSAQLDAPGKARQSDVFLPPLYTSSSSEDGTSSAWSAFFWLAGGSQEADREHTRVLPFYVHFEEEPYHDTTVVFPFYMSKDTVAETWRFYSLLYGFIETEHWTKRYLLAPIFSWTLPKDPDGPGGPSSSVLALWDQSWDGDVSHTTIAPLLGFAHLAKLDLGYPAEGVTVGALGRDESMRISLVDVLGAVTLFGYDDVGDTVETRVLTLGRNERWSLYRYWSSRDPENDFHRHWLFPLFGDVQDETGGWSYVGPIWGRIDDLSEGTETDWWLLGLLSRTRAEAGETWRVFGLPVVGP